MSVRDMFLHLAQLTSPIAAILLRRLWTSYLQLVDVPLTLLVGEHGERGQFVAHGARLALSLYLGDAAPTEMLAAAVGQVGFPLHGTEADRAGERFRRRLHVELFVVQVVTGIITVCCHDCSCSVARDMSHADVTWT